MPDPIVRASLRQFVLALVFIGIVGLQVELALLRHAESFSQWIPHVTLMMGLLTTVAVYFRPGNRTLKTFRAMMILFLVVGGLGVYFHLAGNVEFALERDPSLSGVRLLWKALRGASPALAPGALAQLGLMGLVYGYKHPALSYHSTNEREAVD
jgi:hypothetical protein